MSVKRVDVNCSLSLALWTAPCSACMSQVSQVLITGLQCTARPRMDSQDQYLGSNTNRFYRAACGAATDLPDCWLSVHTPHSTPHAFNAEAEPDSQETCIGVLRPISSCNAALSVAADLPESTSSTRGLITVPLESDAGLPE